MAWVINWFYDVRLILSGLVVLASSNIVTAQIDRDFADMLDGLLSKSVPFISVTALSNLIENNESVYILDTRELEEFQISNISGSIHVGSNTFSIASVKDISKGSLIVVYCSLGVRSEKIGELLQIDGYNNVYNLQGGIFNWINMGYPVYNMKGEMVEIVHPYNRWWGRWVHNVEKSYGK
ncbi:MAG: rhodanese-like domain-containing protein [Luteibaculaceae bacterium]